MNTKQSLSVGQPPEVHQEQPASAPEVRQGPSTAFFAVGIVVNVVMITAFFIWACKQWSKTGSNKKRQQE